MPDKIILHGRTKSDFQFKLFSTYHTLWKYCQNTNAYLNFSKSLIAIIVGTRIRNLEITENHILLESYFYHSSLVLQIKGNTLSPVNCVSLFSTPLMSLSIAFLKLYFLFYSQELIYLSSWLHAGIKKKNYWENECRCKKKKKKNPTSLQFNVIKCLILSSN